MLIPHKVKNKGKYISFHYLRGWKARKIRKVQEISPQIPICTSNRFLHSITVSYYSAINFSNQVPLTIINWSAPFHPCFTGKSDLIVAVIFAAYLLHIHQFSSRFWTSHRIKKEKPQNRSSGVLDLFELYFSCEIIISLRTVVLYELL